ncbi:MAG: MATE family efflux transporter [Dehalococcoidales bacterium]|nr:MATE family efflux transporter [Dehalococcoidales bacterium]
MTHSMMDGRNRNVLDDDRIGGLMLKLTLPAFLGMFVMTLYNVVDTIFIGQYVGPLGIAGLSIVFPLQMFSMGIGQMMGMGGASLISRLIGANNIPRAEHALGNAFSGTIILSAIVMIVGLSNVDFWLRLMGASDTILPFARDYMRIILFGMFFMTFSMSMNTLIRAEGNARVPMIGMIIGAGLNIVLDAVFIILLDMGVQGAALATVIAQFVSTLYFLSYHLTKKSFLRLLPKNLIIQWGIMRDILAIGVSALSMIVAGSIASVFVNRLLVSYGGDIHIAAFGVLHRIMMFALMPGMVIGQGLQPILGFNYGAKRFDRTLRAIRIAVTYASAISCIAFVALYFSPETFLRIFTTDTELINVSVYAAKRVFLVMPLIGLMMVGQLIFQAIGKVIQAITTSLARSALFLLPTVLIFPQFWGIDGVWLAFPVTDVLTLFLTVGLLIPILLDFSRKSKSPTQEPEKFNLPPPPVRLG